LEGLCLQFTSLSLGCRIILADAKRARFNFWLDSRILQGTPGQRPGLNTLDAGRRVKVVGKNAITMIKDEGFIQFDGQISPLRPPTADSGRNDNKMDSAGSRE
jgi:hypothetical protein